MVGHLGQVYHLTIKAQVAPEILQVLHQKPKMKVDDDQFCHVDLSASHVDLSASHVMKFPLTFPDMCVNLKFVLHNSSDFDLVYYWRNVVPRITTRLDALRDANADDWTEIEPAIFPISESRSKESPAVYGHIRRVIKSGETLRFSTTRHLQKAGQQRACIQMVVTNILPKPGKGYTKKIQLNRLTTIPFAVDITATCVEVDMTVPQEVIVEEMVMCGRQTQVMLPISNRTPTAIAVVAEDFMHDLPISEQDFKLKFPPRPTIVSGNTNAHIRLSLTAKCHGQERVARFACREVETGVGFIVSARFVVQVPQLKFDSYVQLGGIPVGEVGTTTFKLSNSSCLTAPWRIFPLLHKTERCVTFKPTEGTLRAGKSIMIKVTVRSDEPVELMAKCLLEVDHVRTRPLWIIASVQHPSLTVAPLHVTFDHLYLGFDCTVEFTLKNPALFRVTFSWGHLKDCQHIRVEHCTPVLIDKLEEKAVSIKFTAIALVNQS
ncbi:hypothetical protein RvY_09964 [Ramazzottius varieornatus]|uniref:HYDIN/VesB/CFA65-like Ig-like domain-containing protein n=1 Tax=Ramazzottius varieornatus TaxID=947166 RepID=A0A1D1VB60_RAMVA|nr:hypothetical protein RvY_09964 [Ramazzottius varieornatus]